MISSYETDIHGERARHLTPAVVEASITRCRLPFLGGGFSSAGGPYYEEAALALWRAGEKDLAKWVHRGEQPVWLECTSNRDTAALWLRLDAIYDRDGIDETVEEWRFLTFVPVLLDVEWRDALDVLLEEPAIGWNEPWVWPPLPEDSQMGLMDDQ